MKKLSLFLLIILPFFIHAQELNSEYFRINGEVYFRFANPGRLIINQLSKIISVDNVTTDSVYAYANENEFREFGKFLFPYLNLPHPGDVKDVKMSSSPEGVQLWDAYPTYDAYVALMQQFAQNYPNICRIHEAGSSILGRKILFAVISDNVNTREAEPQFQYSSSMHGDEITGYVLMLRLIDSLLTSYNTDPRITNLVNNTEIWINPLANPDGTYRSGNTTVSGARRGNNNNIDLNRNFPDPAAGQHPDGNAWQPETVAMMTLAQNNRFVLSANFHGGTEVVNYPWDTWVRRHADDVWWQFVSHQYADTAQAYSPSTYMRGFNDGITNGYDWYRITGGRQDYMNYFMRCREVTLEISNTKLISASLLPAHWEYNKRSLLNYLENALYGIHGKVSLGNWPDAPLIRTNIKINGHDIDNSDIYADSVNLGYYVRMLAPGTYTIRFIPQDTLFPPGFDQEFSNITVSNFNRTVLDVVIPVPMWPVELTSFTGTQNENGITLKWITASEENNRGFTVERTSDNHTWETLSFVTGNGTTTEQNSYIYNDVNPLPGKNIYRLQQTDFDGTVTSSPEIEIVFALPEVFSVSGNYPNPFNPVTAFTITLPEASSVNITIFGMTGELVDKVDYGIFQAGLHKLQINASEYPSGVYFYTIAAGNNLKTGKFTLMK